MMYAIITLIIIVFICVVIGKVQKEKQEKATPITDPYGNQTNVYELKQQYKANHVEFCPSCVSTNVQYVNSRQVGQKDAKTKTTYSANLNPLKPFTLVNEKTKVVKKAQSGVTIEKWHCLNCGRTYEKK